MQREIRKLQTTAITTALPARLADLRAWLEEQVAEHSTLDLRWLLAHCHDGVIWGELREGKLALSCEAFAERGLALRLSTLQQARLFGAGGELLLWPGPQGGWQTTLRRDDMGEKTRYFDEQHLLWGTEQRGTQEGFIKIAEGMQGIEHVPPLKHAPSNAKEQKARARIVVRHYLDEDDTTGMLRVAAGRLMGLLNPQT